MSQLCYHGLQFPIFTEIVTFSYLNAGYQFAEAPIHIIHFVCACPVAAFLVQLVPVAHVDERCREVQSVVRHRKETIIRTKKEIKELCKTLIISVLLPLPISRKPLTFRDLGVYVWCLIIEFKFMDAKLVKIFGMTKCFGNNCVYVSRVSCVTSVISVF